MLAGSCGYLQMNPPPDVNINPETESHAGWMAAAANMLSAAGYGHGQSVQDRAEGIYQDLIEEFGTDAVGWTDAAISWWLQSAHNIWLDNPYKLVSVFGYKGPKIPWENHNLPHFIGKLIRQGNYVALSITWPEAEVDVTGKGGQTINCWGDNEGRKRIKEHPQHLRVSDPYRMSGGALQTYRLDDYENPNPDGPNEGPGWYLAYDENHPYIKNIVVLSAVSGLKDNKIGLFKLASYRLRHPADQTKYKLRYWISSDSVIGQFHAPTSEAQAYFKEPGITINDEDKQVSVTWPISKELEAEEWFTVFSEFIIPEGSGIGISDVSYIIDRNTEIKAAPDVYWNITHKPVNYPARLKNITGGYIIGSFDIYKSDTIPADEFLFAKYRFISQFDFDHRPDEYTLHLYSDSAYCVTNIRLGLKFGLQTPYDLWQFDDWIRTFPEVKVCGEDTLRLIIHTPTRIGYPEGED